MCEQIALQLRNTRPIFHVAFGLRRVNAAVVRREAGDGALIAKALRAYRPETTEEESVVNFFIDEFEKLDKKD